MATAKTAAKAADYWNERIPFTAPVREDGETHLFVCVNGRTFLIERGVQVMLPRCVAAAVEDSARQRARAFRLIQSIQKG